MIKKQGEKFRKDIKMYKDNVKCCNCGFYGLVDKGEEKCPKCLIKGWLCWKENQPQEILI